MSCDVRQCNWRCLDCVGRNAHCTECFRQGHRFLPFHRVEHWTGTHFEPAWLHQVGVEIHLGHQGRTCPSNNGGVNGVGSGSGVTAVDGAEDGAEDGADNEEDWYEEEEEEEDISYGLPKLPGPNSSIVVDKSGIHRIRIHPCTCPGCPPLDLQYLDMGLFPATLRRIKTAFTFKVLDDFRVDNLECKTAALKYYNKLKRLTSNCFPQSVPVSSCFTLHITAPLECYSGQVQGAALIVKIVAEFKISEVAWIRPCGRLGARAGKFGSVLCGMSSTWN